MQQQKLLVTNNPLASQMIKEQELSGSLTLDFVYGDFVAVLAHIRDLVHQGAVLLTHPLSGSVKPKETPYKSVLLARPKSSAKVDERSLELIEQAQATTKKFVDRTDSYQEAVLNDFQLIDWQLIKNALVSAELL